MPIRIDVSTFHSIRAEETTISHATRDPTSLVNLVMRTKKEKAKKKRNDTRNVDAVRSESIVLVEHETGIGVLSVGRYQRIDCVRETARRTTTHAANPSNERSDVFVQSPARRVGTIPNETKLYVMLDTVILIRKIVTRTCLRTVAFVYDGN